jgi:hypothetical protein
MIGVSSKFAFSVANHNPPWMDDEEDELLEARRRPRTHVPVSVPVSVPDVAPAPVGTLPPIYST